MIEIILAIFAFIISWILLTQKTRDSRYDRKSVLYTELSSSLSKHFLLRISSDRNPDMYLAEYTKNRVDLTEFVLINKLTISQEVGDSSMAFLASHTDDQDTMMDNLNTSINAMRKELGLNKIDSINQLMRVESFLENSQQSISKKLQKK